MAADTTWFYISTPTFPSFPSSDFHKAFVRLLSIDPQAEASLKHIADRAAALGFKPDAVKCLVLDQFEDYAYSGDPGEGLPADWGKLGVEAIERQIEKVKDLRKGVTFSDRLSEQLADAYPLARTRVEMDKKAAILLEELEEEVAERREGKLLYAKPRDVTPLVRGCLTVFVLTGEPFVYFHIKPILDICMAVAGNPERLSKDYLRQIVTDFYQKCPLRWGNMWREAVSCGVLHVIPRERYGIDPADTEEYKIKIDWWRFPAELNQTVATLLTREAKYLKRRDYFKTPDGVAEVSSVGDQPVGNNNSPR